MRKNRMVLTTTSLDQQTDEWLRSLEHVSIALVGVGVYIYHVIDIDRKVDGCDGPFNHTYTIGLYDQAGNEMDNFLYCYIVPDVTDCTVEVKTPEDRLGKPVSLSRQENQHGWNWRRWFHLTQEDTRQ
jgi:aspartokinase-like uncharacterized kinase